MTMDAGEQQPVLILGAGINGCAVARELALNGVGVWLVDVNDITFGATSRSSRLIHGGLRYLEYGDFRLVRESLEERSRLRKLAPQFVEPVRLYIPVRRRAAGLIRSVFRFLGGSRFRPFDWISTPSRDSCSRGLWLVRMGLWLYDWLAREEDLPRSEVYSTTAPNVPRVDIAKYRWLCAYTDSQMRFPERFVIALLEDVRQLAQRNGTEFRVLTYHEVRLKDGTAEIHRRSDNVVVGTLQPPIVINATGAWGDLTLGQLNVPSRRLFGGTKGSHFVTGHAQLRQLLGDAGVYAEAADGRLIFVLPFGTNVLVGTTDERFEERPEQAIASPRELNYLIGMVNELFADVNLSRTDIDFHYSGIRPLPYSRGGKTASIPRSHQIVTHEKGAVPVLTLIGGKLTTCRAFAEEVADRVFARLRITRTANTRNRIIPGGRDYPTDRATLQKEWDRLAKQFRLSVNQIRVIWSLCGNRIETIFCELEAVSANNLSGTQIPIAFVRWIIENEWVTTLDDLVERRLMLVHQPDLSRECLHQLASCLVESGRLEPAQLDAEIQSTADHLRDFYGKQLSDARISPIPA